MFQFHVHSQDFLEAMKKISIAIPSATTKGGADGVKMVYYKMVKGVNKSMGLLLAFDGKVQAVSSMIVEDVTSDEDEIEVHVKGKTALAAATAYAALNTVLEVTIDKNVRISGAGNIITLQLGEKIVALKPNDALIQEIEVNKDDFVNFVNFAASCHGEEKGGRGMHCVGICIDEEKKKMIAMSTNGMRCAYAETDKIVFGTINKKKEEGTEHPKQVTVILEGKQLKNAVRNLGKKKVAIGIDDKRIKIKSGTDVVMILTQDIPFPMGAMLQVFAKCKKVGAWKAGLNAVLQALAIFEATMETPWLEIRRQGETQVSFHGKDELTTASVVCAQEGVPQSVTLDETEWKNALSVFAKEQDIIVETMSETDPVTLRQREEDPNRIIILPISED